MCVKCKQTRTKPTMDQKFRDQEIQERLHELKSKIGLLLPMIRCCKDELNDLTLQEMEIRSAIRSKMQLKFKQEQLDNTEIDQEEEYPANILGLPSDLDFEDEAEDNNVGTEEDGKAVDYREFLTLDPKFVKIDSDEEEEDDEDERNDLSEDDCENIFLADDEN